MPPGTFRKSELLRLNLEAVLMENVTGFWKNRPNCHTSYSISLRKLIMATLVHYTYTVQLPGLVDWSAFLERVLPTL